ncbi:MAG: hypothetical protein H0T42_00200 [Deltaproteobacteria bacterium]|nr:hypothetical protein [Deltaproteobacteria bacterium]
MLALGALLCAASLAHAQPAPAAPPADQASGIAIEEPEPLGERLRWIPRAVLFVPRWAFWLLVQPVRAGGWAYERFMLRDRVKGALFNVDQTYGVYPVAGYSSDYGVSVGVRAVHYNVLGNRERLKLLVDFGGQFRQAVGLQLSTGRRVADRFSAWLDVRFERRPGERFFGIGNDSELETPPPTLIDPATSETAVASRFREQITRFKATLDATLLGPFTARASGALALREFGTEPDDLTPIGSRYDTSRLVGWKSGVENIYVEGELIYDTRRPTSQFQTQAIDATGWYVALHAGRAKGIRDDPTAYTRYGGEVQRYFDLYRGSRVLALRLLVDGIVGSDGRTDGKISFIDLPRLGGPEHLRGYPADRFRDRTVTLATAEYTWDLGNYLAGYLFVDAGRAWKHLGRVELDSLHVGFGGGVQVHSYRSFVMRGQLALSRDGDAFVELVLAPAFGRRERAGRY